MSDTGTSAAAAAGQPPSLSQLADVVAPPPISWMPQTVGWKVLAVLLVLIAIWLAWRGTRNWLRNRYRRDALAELRQIETCWKSDPAASVAVLTALPALIKRCALAAWPREQVASRSGAEWARFLVANAGHATPGALALEPLVREIQYHDEQVLRLVPQSDVAMLIEASRQWIQGHVSA
ncbi:DUF4381 domain-containing protein [Variovorax robiniae]|uniref:DUF4381 domain-containing protein n=1 Tax=Variovorax robiniae TaxID=1836199 RepID=A0ABU8XJH1_9BURK